MPNPLRIPRAPFSREDARATRMTGRQAGPHGSLGFDIQGSG